MNSDDQQEDSSALETYIQPLATIQPHQRPSQCRDARL